MAVGCVTEREFQAEVVKTARSCGWITYHTHDSRRSDKGFPDLVLVRERVVFAELKTDTGRESAEQLEWMRRLKRAGAEAYVWRPRHMDDIHATLTRGWP